jgi:hypothetical protein
MPSQGKLPDHKCTSCDKRVGILDKQPRMPRVLRCRHTLRAQCVKANRLSRSKDCGGSGICEHGRLKRQCKDCGGSGICEHGRVKWQCKDCGGSGMRFRNGQT